MNCRSFQGIVLLLSCSFLGAAVAAQDAITESGRLAFSGEYLVEETFVGSADVRNGAVRVRNFDESDTILRFVLTPRIKLGLLRLGAEWERFSFDFPRHTALPGTLQAVSLVLGLDTQLSDSILLRVEAQPGVYNTGFDDLSDDFNAPFIVGGTYIYNPSLQIVLGVGVDIEREYAVIPAAGIRWKVARQWVINGVLPTPRIEFEWYRDLTLYVGANTKQTNFRVEDDFGDRHGNPRLDHAVLSYSEVRTGVGFEWKISPVLTLTGEIGYQPYRSFDFYRADIRFEENGSSAPYGMVSLHGAF
jgi:hypothetical protein